MIVEEIPQETCRHFGALRAAAARDFRHRRVQTGGRELAVFLNHALDAIAFGAVDQRVLQLLRIDARGILVEQGHNVVGSDHVFHDALVFEQPHPGGQPFLLRHTFGGIVGRSGSDQIARVLRNIHPGIERFRADLLAIQRTQRDRRPFRACGRSGRIAVPVAEHDVVLGAEEIVAPVFGEQQPVQKQRIREVAAAAGFFAEQRAAGARQRALLHFAQRLENFLPGLAQDDLLPHLECDSVSRYSCAFCWRMLS